MADRRKQLATRDWIRRIRDAQSTLAETRAMRAAEATRSADRAAGDARDERDAAGEAWAALASSPDFDLQRVQLWSAELMARQDRLRAAEVGREEAAEAEKLARNGWSIAQQRGDRALDDLRAARRALGLWIEEGRLSEGADFAAQRVWRGA